MTKNKTIFILTFTFLAFLSFISFKAFKRGNILDKNIINDTPVSKSILFLGDTGSGNSNQTVVSEAMENYCKLNSCNSIFILGDVIYEEGVESVNDSQFESKFELPYKNIDLPFYIAFGNHDYLGCRNCYLDYSKKSTRWKMPDYYYSQSVDSDLEIFVIDTENFTKKQQDWLANKLSESKSKWKIVSGHRPIVAFEKTKHYEDWNGKSELLDIICNTADLYISGHAHTMERNTIPNCKAEQIISGGGGASLRDFTENNKSVFSVSTYGFFSLSFKPRELYGNFIDTQGNTLHKFTITK